jgi:Bacterial-like globin
VASLAPAHPRCAEETARPQPQYAALFHALPAAGYGAADQGDQKVAETPPAAAKPSFYDRLGGVYSIATVVDDFRDRIMVDPRLNVNPHVDEAHHRVPPPGFKYLVTEMLCWAAGGPQTHTGRNMASSHEHLKITAGEW